MSQVVTLQNILDQVNDFNQNYSVTTIDAGNKIRAINRAIEYVQQRLGLPSDRKIMTFKFYEDTNFYDLPDGYSDLIGLFYNITSGSSTGDFNTYTHEWTPIEDTTILRTTGLYPGQNRYAFTSQNGKNQLLLDGTNIHSSTIINALNSLTGLTFSSSITGDVVDSNIYKYGGGSVKFNVDNTETISTILFTGNYNIQQFLNYGGAYRLWVYFPTGVDTTVLSSVELRLQSSTGNYYYIRVTTDYLNAAWASGGWSKLSFDLANASTTGSPDASSITSVYIVLNHGGSFSSITGMRVNELYFVQPDLLDLVYYSAIKGTDSTGATNKIWLTSGDDILSFGSFAPDLILPISLKAALLIWPQLREDANFYPVYQTDFKEVIELYGKRYPRKRNPIAGPTRLKR